MPKFLWRTEAYSGSKVRDAAEIMRYEIFELGNTDIIDTLVPQLQDDRKMAIKLLQIADEIEENGYVDDIGAGDQYNFCQLVLASLGTIFGVEIKYGLWLAEKETVIAHYGKDGGKLDQYETGSVVLSNIGEEGVLFGYEQEPAIVVTINNPTKTSADALPANAIL